MTSPSRHEPLHIGRKMSPNPCEIVNNRKLLGFPNRRLYRVQVIGIFNLKNNLHLVYVSKCKTAKVVKSFIFVIIKDVIALPPSYWRTFYEVKTIKLVFYNPCNVLKYWHYVYPAGLLPKLRNSGI